MKTPLLDALQTRVLLNDGAMGTQLQLAGLEPGGCGDRWNLDHPEIVSAIHQLYADAGADCLTTNTFRSNRIALGPYEVQDQAYALNRSGAEIARRVAGPDRYVLGDVGPSDSRLDLCGPTARVDLAAAFEEQIRGLVDGGVDAILLETMTALDEIEVAVAAARNGAPDLPLIVSLAYGRIKSGGFQTLAGVSPEDASRALMAMNVDVLACNCGAGIDMGDMQTILAIYRAAGDKPVMAQPNAGTPELRGAEIVYHETPEIMTDGIWGLVRAGASIVGGCCGTTPEHIAQFRQELDKL